MPGRLCVRESLYSMLMHVAGLSGRRKSSNFCLMSPIGIISIVLVDFIRIDLSHQTVRLVAALLLPQPDIGVVHLGPLDGALVGSLVCIEVDHDEALFWKNTFCPLSLSGVASGNTSMHASIRSRAACLCPLTERSLSSAAAVLAPSLRTTLPIQHPPTTSPSLLCAFLSP